MNLDNMEWYLHMKVDGTQRTAAIFELLSVICMPRITALTGTTFDLCSVINLLFSFSRVIFLLNRLKIRKLPFTMQAADNTLGSGSDLDGRPKHHGILQQTVAGDGAETALDEDDMHRMGKVQLFKVCPLPSLCVY